jgi:hypothetical protein
MTFLGEDMMTITTIRLRSLGAGAALAFLCASGPVLAQDSDAAALEARVAQLEALIEKLTKAEEKVAPAAAPATKSATTTYKFGGYAKFDAMFTDYSDGTPSGNSLMRQFYYAPQIPVGDGTSSSDSTSDFQARETRLNFRADTTTAGGSKITAFVEMDFLTHGDGNEVVSNSYSPRLRHAFVKYNKWTFGQTWSTFMDVSVLPEALDFVGPAESTTFIRQSMIRYTSGNLELALENPQTFVSGVAADDRGLSTVPDLIARYTFKMDGGSYVRVAGLVRSLKIPDMGSGSQADESAYGLSASAKFVLGNGHDIRAMATIGDGVGRYIGLGLVPDGYVDNVTGNIETADALAWFVSYRAVWNDKWRSNFMYGTTSIDYNDDLQAAALNDTASSVHVNLIRKVAPKLDIGAEILFGDLEKVNGTDGDFTRFMLSAKYAF